MINSFRPLIRLPVGYPTDQNSVHLANLILKAINLPNTQNPKYRMKLAGRELTWSDYVKIEDADLLFHMEKGIFRNIVISRQARYKHQAIGDRPQFNTVDFIIDPRLLRHGQIFKLETTYPMSPMHLMWRHTENTLEGSSIQVLIAYWIKLDKTMKQFTVHAETMIERLEKERLYYLNPPQQRTLIF